MITPTKNQLRAIVYLEGYYRCYQLLFFQKRHPQGCAEDCYFLDCQDAVLEAFKELVSKRSFNIFFDEFSRMFKMGWEVACGQVEREEALEQIDGEVV